MTVKPKTYKKQHSCQDCGHVFRMYEYEGASQFFCHFDLLKRPLCGSVAMGEVFPERAPFKKNKEYSEMSAEERAHEYELNHRSWARYERKWEAWSEPRAVDACGICDKWVPIEDCESN